MVWLIIGFAIYFGYSRKHSALRKRRLEAHVEKRSVREGVEAVLSTLFSRRIVLSFTMPSNSISIPPERVAAARQIAAILKPGRRVALTTHVNADGDGVGSEVALWHLLRARGLDPVIANPTGIPERFGFLVPPGADASDRAGREIARADVVVVVDISDLGRLGDLAKTVHERGAPVACIDHHVSPGTLPDGPRLVAPEATATAELVFDLAAALEWPLSAEAARALYVGILTDTGGFRFSNTSARALRVAAALLEHGVEPESIYEAVYASAPEGRVRLLAEVLQTLVVEPERGLAWVTVPAGRARAPRRHAGRSGRHRGACPLDRRRAAGVAVPPDRQRPHQGVVPLDGERRFGRARPGVRGRRAPQGGRRVAGGIGGGGPGARAERGAALAERRDHLVRRRGGRRASTSHAAAAATLDTANGGSERAHGAAGYPTPSARSGGP